MNQTNVSELRVTEKSALSSAPTNSDSARLAYEVPRVTPLGEWTVLTLASSAPVIMSLPIFGL